jgi:Icc-related predicted phosphoesterase
LRIVAFSDTHGMHLQLGKLPEGDVIIHAGDLSGRGSPTQCEDFIYWMGKLPGYSHRIIVPGNHDWYFESYPDRAQEYCKANGVILLNDSGVKIDGMHFWGSPVQPRFHNWAFNRDRFDEIKKHWDLIPKDTNVLITHGPPYEILDEVLRVDGSPYNPPRKVGCEELRTAVENLPELKLHIFGHIHSGHGKTIVNGVKYVNVAICNEMYDPCNEVTVVEV